MWSTISVVSCIDIAESPSASQNYNYRKWANMSNILNKSNQHANQELWMDKREKEKYHTIGSVHVDGTLNLWNGSVWRWENCTKQDQQDLESNPRPSMREDKAIKEDPKVST